VSDDPVRPKLVKSFDSSEKAGFTGPHSPYALPGRMLISYLGGKDGGLPAGLAEFDNDGTFIRKLDLPPEAPYGYLCSGQPQADNFFGGQLRRVAPSVSLGARSAA
jgi:methanethiol oxidase